MQSSCKDEQGPLLIATHFAALDDPRVVGRTRHPLMTVIVMAVAAVVGGATGWEGIEDFVEDRKAWFATFPRTATARRLRRSWMPRRITPCN